jgi:hypothetical protein
MFLYTFYKWENEIIAKSFKIHVEYIDNYLYIYVLSINNCFVKTLKPWLKKVLVQQ